MCRDGANCVRSDCFFAHPKERILKPPEPFQLHLDEFAMPKRPKVSPADTDREVFVDPFPAIEGSEELAEFLNTFGQVDDVYQISGRDCGYVRFKHHSSAQACVDNEAGAWSESERVLSSHHVYGDGGCKVHRDSQWDGATQSAYPASLVSYIVGPRRQNIFNLMDSSGVKLLHINEGESDSNSVSRRVNFTGVADELQLQRFRIEVECLLARAHERLSELLQAAQPRALIATNLPPTFKYHDARRIFLPHGTIESLTLDGQFTRVLFCEADAAKRAAEALEGMEFHSESESPPLHCELQEVDASEHNTCLVIHGVPGAAIEEDLRAICERVGPLASLQIGVDRKTKQNKSYAFVEYVHASDAARASEVIDKTCYLGHTLNLNRAKSSWVALSPRATSSTSPVIKPKQFSLPAPAGGRRYLSATDAIGALLKRQATGTIDSSDKRFRVFI